MKCQPEPKASSGGSIWPKFSLSKVVTDLGTCFLYWGYIWPKVNMPEVVPHLAMRCLYWGYIWPKVSLPDVVPCLVIRCLYWGIHLTKDQTDLKFWQKCQPDPKPPPQGGTCDQRSAWSEELTKMSTWSKPLHMGVHLTTGQHDQKIWQNVNLTQFLILGVVCLTKGRSDLKIWQKCQPDPKPDLVG